MGFREIFGIAYYKLTLKSDYPDIEDFYEKIKDEKFMAGTPQLVRSGVAPVIAFPQLDRNNQVQILKYVNSSKYAVSRCTTPAGFGNISINAALDEFTGNLTALSGVVGNTKKRCMELTKITAEHLNGMGL